MIPVVGPDRLEFVRAKFFDQPISVFYQLVDRPSPSIPFLNNKVKKIIIKKKVETKITRLFTYICSARICVLTPFLPIVPRSTTQPIVIMFPLVPMALMDYMFDDAIGHREGFFI